jgi:hypothetical protein
MNRLMILFLALGIAVLACGCTRPARLAVPIAGMPVQPEYATLVEVDNFYGSVRVIADPSREPAVWATVRREGPEAPRKRGELAELVHVEANTTIEEGQRMLRVVTMPVGDVRDVAVDVTVRIARSAGTAVRNSGGRVDLIRVAGPVHVENGIAGQEGGDVQIRTGAPMVGPTFVRTSEGTILYQVGPGSAGRFDLRSEHSRAEFASRLGRVENVTFARNSWRGILNRGENEIMLEAPGLVRAAVMEDSESYTTFMFDGYPPRRYRVQTRGE